MNGTGNGESNKPTINWVTRTQCVIGFMFAAAICVLSYLEKGIPPELNTLAGIVIGGLLSMLTKSTPTTSTETPPARKPTPVGDLEVPAQTLEVTK